MGQVIASASMSLDGYIAKQDNSIGRLFDWLQSGDIETPTASPAITFHLTQASADYWREWTSQLGALVCGRTLFDFTDGWGGRHTWTSRSWSSRIASPPSGSMPMPDAPFTSSPAVSRRPCNGTGHRG